MKRWRRLGSCWRLEGAWWTFDFVWWFGELLGLICDVSYEVLLGSSSYGNLLVCDEVWFFCLSFAVFVCYETDIKLVATL